MTQAEIEQANRQTAEALCRELAGCLRDLEQGEPSIRTVAQLTAIFTRAAALDPESPGAAKCMELVGHVTRDEWDQAATILRKLLRLMKKQYGLKVPLGGRHLQLVK